MSFSEPSAIKSIQESIEASLAAAQNKHDADAACRMCRQGQTNSSRRLLLCAKARHASASSIIKIWIVLTASVTQHLPLSRHTSPLPPNVFSPPKHIPTHNSSCNGLQSLHTPQQPNRPLLCPAAGVSESQYDVSPTVRHLQALPLCHRSKLKPKLCSCWCLAQPHFAFALSGFVEQLLQAPRLCCLVPFQHTFLNDLFPLKEELSFNLNECHHTCAASADQVTDALTENDQGKHRSKRRLKCATATAMHVHQSDGSRLGSHTRLRSGRSRSRALKGIAYIYACLPECSTRMVVVPP